MKWLFNVLKGVDFYFIPYLIFLLFPIIGFFSGDYPLWSFIATGCFLVSYIWVIKYNYKTYWVNILWVYMLMYIVAVVSFLNINMIWYFFYLAHLLVWVFEDKLKSYRFVSFCVAVTATFCYYIFFNWQHHIGELFYISIMLIFLVSMIVVMSYQRYSIENAVARQETNRRINILISEYDRNRISGDLHDQLGHTFAAIVLKSELSLKLLDGQHYQKVQTELNQIKEIAQESMNRVRDIVRNVHSITLDEVLIKLKILFEVSSIQLTIENNFSITHSIDDIIMEDVGMILQELSTNVIKHAEATQMSISLNQKQDDLIIDVEDNGNGFEEVVGDELYSIRERLARIDGNLNIVSRKNPTHICVTIPVRGEKE